MELRQFTYVNMVAECGSFTKAAAKLFISQPALSNYISKVEDELGVRLFDRSANPLILTYAGEQYLKRTRKILMQISDMDREMRDITHHMQGKLKLGFPVERVIYMLPMVLKPFKERYPGIDVELVTQPGNILIQNLREGNVDFAILPSWVPQKDIRQIKIADEELLLVGAKGYLQEDQLLDAKRKIVNWKAVAKLPLITLKKGHALRSSVDVLYRNLGAKPDIVLESHSNILSCLLAGQGLGIAVVPELTLQLIREIDDLEVYHLSEMPITWEVQALHRADFYIGEVEQAFLDILREEINARKRQQLHKKRL